MNKEKIKETIDLINEEKYGEASTLIDEMLEEKLNDKIEAIKEKCGGGSKKKMKEQDDEEETDDTEDDTEEEPEDEIEEKKSRKKK